MPPPMMMKSAPSMVGRSASADFVRVEAPTSVRPELVEGLPSFSRAQKGRKGLRQAQRERKGRGLRAAPSDPAHALNPRPIARELVDLAAEQAGGDALGGAAVAIEVGAHFGRMRHGEQMLGGMEDALGIGADAQGGAGLDALGPLGRRRAAPAWSCRARPPPPERRRESVRTRRARCISRTKRGKSSGGSRWTLAWPPKAASAAARSSGWGWSGKMMATSGRSASFAKAAQIARKGAPRLSRRWAVTSTGWRSASMMRQAGVHLRAQRRRRRRAGRSPDRARRCRYCR